MIEAILRPFTTLGAAIWQRVQDEPVYTQGMIVAGIAVGTSFGLSWDAEQTGAVTAFSAIVLAWLTRKSVTANANLP